MLESLFVLFVILLYVFLDSLFYGIFYEYNIKKIKIGSGFMYNSFFTKIFNSFSSQISWLMNGSESKFSPYRILQVIFQICALLFVYFNLGLVPVLFLIASYYFMVYEFSYYIFLGQMKYISKMNEAPWLKKWYFSGGLLFMKKYSYDLFAFSALIGALFYILIPLFS